VPARLRIECRKVPAALLAPGSWVLPCLGALTTGHLLGQAAAGVAVEVVDRGWCQGCEAGCGGARPEHPAAAALAGALMWLQAIGESNEPRLVTEVLPVTQRPAVIPPAPGQAPPVDRRRFFRAALERPAGRDRAPTPMGADGRAAYPADARRPSPERERQRAALEVLAAARASVVPAEFYPALHADASCCDRRMCVALCPTAALQVADDGAAARLQFDPVRCIACGTCVRACPQTALVLQPHGGSAEVQTLATHRQRHCPSCGETYAVTEEAGAEPAAAPALCPACTKSNRLIADARRQLFGAMN
jgi:Fe-S-cluster-containing dehydrogenase component